MPVSMSKGGATYYLTYDQVGSLRIVSDASGNVAKRIDYDSFGSIINDTNPTFTIPFGFAGGLHDRDSGLVRFGFRDYDPDTGRWTAKDPIEFRGGDVDLYRYVQSNPVNLVDPRGLMSPLAHIAIHLATHLAYDLFVEPNLHDTRGEDEWMADYWRKLEDRGREKLIEESGLREYLEEVEALNKRLDAIISIYENEFPGQPCP